MGLLQSSFLVFFLFFGGALSADCSVLSRLATKMHFVKLDISEVDRARESYTTALRQEEIPRDRLPKTAEETLGFLLAARKKVGPADQDWDLSRIAESKLLSRKLRKELADLDFKKGVNGYDIEEVFLLLFSSQYGDPSNQVFRLKWGKGEEMHERRRYERSLSRRAIVPLFEKYGLIGPVRGLKRLTQFVDKHPVMIEGTLTTLGLLPVLSLGLPSYFPTLGLMTRKNREEQAFEVYRRLGFKRGYRQVYELHGDSIRKDFQIRVFQRALISAFVASLGIQSYQEFGESQSEWAEALQAELEEAMQLQEELAELEDELPQQVQQWEKENLASFLERFDRLEENERVLLEALNTHVAEVSKELTRDQRSLVAGWALLLLRRRGFTILRRWLKDPLFTTGGLSIALGGATALTYDTAKELKDMERFRAELETFANKHNDREARVQALRQRLRDLEAKDAARENSPRK